MQRFFGLIPAAGQGARAGLDQPKQYQMLNGRSIIDRALDAFRACPSIEAIYVVLSSSDHRFNTSDARVTPLYCGGSTRRESVLNGLNLIANRVDANDWILVHDAARPGLSLDRLTALIEACRDDPVGGLLALPVADTLKRANGDRVDTTLAREQIWAAQTPQMFRYQLLHRALGEAKQVTDEASAVEALGLKPRLVQGCPRNFKITYRDDLQLAAALFDQAGASQ